MKILNHRLCHDDGTSYPYVPSPNYTKGKTLAPEYLVMHYTAGGSAQESIEWLASELAAASAHILIGRDGSITQQVPFDRIAWHAGVSFWKGRNGLNPVSIGIELDNPGKLAGKPGAWKAFGKTVPDAGVLVATHKNEHEPAAWAKYPKAQLAAAREVARLLVTTFGLREIVGHDDLAPNRKTDPGPAFPMDAFRAAVLGEPSASPAPLPVLRIGARGHDVVRLQKALGMPEHLQTGYFGGATAAAVGAFQNRAALAADRIVGPATWRALGLL